MAVQDNLGRLLRAERERRDISLRRAARQMEKSAAYISDLETGKTSWSHKNIALYMAALVELTDKAKPRKQVTR